MDELETMLEEQGFTAGGDNDALDSLDYQQSSDTISLQELETLL